MLRTLFRSILSHTNQRTALVPLAAKRIDASQLKQVAGGLPKGGWPEPTATMAGGLPKGGWC
jgi:hypothetical protein